MARMCCMALLQDAAPEVREEVMPASHVTRVELLSPALTVLSSAVTHMCFFAIQARKGLNPSVSGPTSTTVAAQQTAQPVEGQVRYHGRRHTPCIDALPGAMSHT